MTSFLLERLQPLVRELTCRFLVLARSNFHRGTRVDVPLEGWMELVGGSLLRECVLEQGVGNGGNVVVSLMVRSTDHNPAVDKILDLLPVLSTLFAAPVVNVSSSFVLRLLDTLTRFPLPSYSTLGPFLDVAPCMTLFWTLTMSPCFHGAALLEEPPADVSALGLGGGVLAKTREARKRIGRIRRIVQIG